MSKKANFIIIIVYAMLLIGCTTKAPKDFDLKQLTRVDVEVVKVDENYEETRSITDEETLEIVRKNFMQIKWEPNAEPKMARKEDVMATLFFTYDENMPERLFEYQIWFNQSNKSATIISNNQKEGIGTLHKENAEILEKVLIIK